MTLWVIVGAARVGLAAAPNPAIEIKPPGLSLDRPPAAELKRSFLVRAATPEPLAVLAVQSLDPAIQVEWKVHRPDRLYVVTAILPAGYSPPPGQRARIVITTNRPDSPTLEIPIQILPPAATRPAPPEAETLIGQPAPAITLKTTDDRTMSVMSTAPP